MDVQTSEKSGLRPIVMSVTVVLFGLMLIAIVIDAKNFYNSLLCLVMVLFCVVCMVTPIGKIRLGGPMPNPNSPICSGLGSLCAPGSGLEWCSGGLRNR